jgi:serine phosphatase RsbU (regulator of sigma subunit)
MSTVARILVVDDTPNNVLLLEDMLSARGYQVATAADGIEALASVAADAPDLVLLDIMMPRMDGYEVLEKLQADPAYRHIPVIMISAVDELDSVIRCIALGAEDYLPKPFNSALLRARVSASLEKKLLRDEILQHMRRMERELEVARTIQLSMLPTDFPVPSPARPVAVYAALEQAHEVGGDLYDFFWVTPDRMGLVVADVSDKGAAAALYMARVKGAIRVLATQLAQSTGAAPACAELVSRVNEDLCRDNPHAMFVTLLLCMVDTRNGRVEWCNAGHYPPYLLAPDGAVTSLAGDSSPPAGTASENAYTSCAVQLSPGSTLFLFTDGITEAMNERKEPFGTARLEATLRSRAAGKPDALIHSVLREVQAFVGSAGPSDDIAVLACRWSG